MDSVGCRIVMSQASLRFTGSNDFPASELNVAVTV